MKRYYTSFLRYNFVMTLLPVLFIVNGVLFTIGPIEPSGIFGRATEYFNYLWFIMAIFSFINVYRIYKKQVYFEINKTSMVYSFGKIKKIYEFEDAEHFVIRPTGKQRKIYIKSIKKGKMVKVNLSIFEMNYDEFIVLLSDYSGKEVYFKDYGEEPKLIRK